MATKGMETSGDGMLSISWDNLTMLEMVYLLSNNVGWVDGDKKTIEVMVKG